MDLVNKILELAKKLSGEAYFRDTKDRLKTGIRVDFLNKDDILLLAEFIKQNNTKITITSEIGETIRIEIETNKKKK